MEPLVYCIILNWNSAADVIACVENLEGQYYQNFKIVLVDNASPDGSEEILREQFSQHDFIQTGKNLGYGGGNNQGIRHALQRGADFVWILNPDIRVSANTLSEMIRVMKNDPSVGICGPRILWDRPFGVYDTYGIHFACKAGYWPVPRTVTVSETLKPSQKTEEVVSVLGCSMLVRSALFHKAGLIREDFFMYHEETEFNLRAQSEGWKSVLCGNVQDAHLHNARSHPSWEQYYLTRNQVLLARIRKKFVLRTVFHAAFFSEWRQWIKREKVRNIKKFLAPIIDGLCARIKPAPLLSDAGFAMKAGVYPEIKPIEEKNRPFWSVMIPTMERPHYLEQALKSVLDQNVPPEEMQIEVIGDDITSEATQKMVEELGRGRVTFYRQTGRKTQSEQWNTCIRRAKGRWVHIFHDDDVLVPGFYKAYSVFAQKYPQAGLIFCRAITIDEHGKILGLMGTPPDNKASGMVRNAIEHLLSGDYITAPAAMVKREIYEHIGGADPSFHYALDWDLFMRAAIQTPMVYIHDPYLCYRVHSETVSTNFIRRGLTVDESFKIFKKYFSYIPPAMKENVKKAFYKNTSKRSFDMSRGMLKERYYWGAFRHGLWTLYLKPSRKGFIQCAKSLLAFLKLRTPWEAVHSSGQY